MKNRSNDFSNRRLDNKFNVFENLHKNLYFIAINIVIITGQVLIVTIGGNALSTTPLSPKEWVISIALGAFCLPVAVLIRLIPDGAIRNILSQKATPRILPPVSSNHVTWLSTVDHIRTELSTISQPRSSRVRPMSMDFWNYYGDGTLQKAQIEEILLMNERHYCKGMIEVLFVRRLWL